MLIFIKPNEKYIQQISQHRHDFARSGVKPYGACALENVYDGTKNFCLI